MIDFLKKIPNPVWFALILALYWLLTGSNSPLSSKSTQSIIMEDLLQDRQNSEAQLKLIDEKLQTLDQRLQNVNEKEDSLAKVDKESFQKVEQQYKNLIYVLYETKKDIGNYRDSSYNAILKRLQPR